MTVDRGGVKDDPVDVREHPDFPELPVPAPWANEELIGHDEAERRLAGLVANERIAGAWIIGGRAGIGKATLAWRLARHLLCGPGEDLFGEPPATLEFDAGDPAAAWISARSHGDVLGIELSLNERGRRRQEVVVDDVRRIRPFFARTAGNDGWRVAIIDDADLMNRSAANAALKVIEEPPRRAVVLLVSAAPSSLLATIRSRCRKLPLSPILSDQMELLLERYLPDWEAAERASLAHLSGGSPGRALLLAEKDGLALYREMIGLVAMAPDIDPAALHGLAERLARPGGEASWNLAFDFLTDWSAAMIRKAATGKAAPPVLPEETEAMARIAGDPALEPWMAVWEKVAHLRRTVQTLNLDRRQSILSVFGTLQAAVRT